jgi:hypothetical protein
MSQESVNEYWRIYYAIQHARRYGPDDVLIGLHERSGRVFKLMTEEERQAIIKRHKT